MQITVTNPDEFAAQVQSRGLTPKSFVERLIAEQIARRSKTCPLHFACVPAFRPRAGFGRLFNALAANSDKLP